MLVWFRLKQAADKLNWYFETELPELDTESDGTRLSWATHLRQHGVVLYAHSHHHQCAWTVPHTVPHTVPKWFIR